MLPWACSPCFTPVFPGRVLLYASALIVWVCMVLQVSPGFKHAWARVLDP